MSDSEQQTSIEGSAGSISVRRWQREDPQHVVLIAHGYGEHAGRYTQLGEILAGAHAAVYAPDHRGHGNSGGDRALITNVDDLVEDFHLVAQLAEREHAGLPIAVIGHSTGGLLALRYAQHDPAGVGALILTSPIVGGSPALQHLLDADPMPELALDPRMLSDDPGVQTAYTEDPLVWHGSLPRETLKALSDAMTELAAGSPFGQIPVLWQHGEDDELAPIDLQRPILEGMRGQQFEHQTYPGARHDLFHESCSDQVIADVIHFIERSLDAPPAPPHAAPEHLDENAHSEGLAAFHPDPPQRPRETDGAQRSPQTEERVPEHPTGEDADPESHQNDENPIGKAAGKVRGAVDSAKDTLHARSEKDVKADAEGATDLRHQDLLG